MLFIGPHVFVDQSGPAVSLGAAHGQAGIPSISSAFNSGLVDARVHLMVSFFISLSIYGISFKQGSQNYVDGK